MDSDLLTLRKKVSREAASLIYFGVEKEYKQAKIKAANTFGTHFLPTNLEVALELDKIAEENEGEARQKRLTQMRILGLKLMKILKRYSPKLVGSVWRGTAYRESDIDIIVYHDEPGDILETLKQNDIKIVQTEWATVTKRGKRKKSFHIHLEFDGEKIEVIVRSPEDAQIREKCEIYGDEITGLRIHELEKLLKENPTKRFIPA